MVGLSPSGCVSVSSQFPGLPLPIEGAWGGHLKGAPMPACADSNAEVRAAVLVKVELPSGRVIRVGSGVEPEALARLVLLLDPRAC